MESRRLRPYVRCPRAREDDPCTLPPGVRFCMCEESGEPVAEVQVREGQLFWRVGGDNNAPPRSWYSYLAVVGKRAAGVRPEGPAIELEGEANVVPSNDGERRVFRVREKGTGRDYFVEACDLVYAAQEGHEIVVARPVESV
jgi:hypothetical protein